MAAALPLLIQIGIFALTTFSPLITAAVKKGVAALGGELPNEIKPMVNLAAGILIAAAATSMGAPLDPSTIVLFGTAGALGGAKVRDQVAARRDRTELQRLSRQ